MLTIALYVNECVCVCLCACVCVPVCVCECECECVSVLPSAAGNLITALMHQREEEGAVVR